MAALGGGAILAGMVLGAPGKSRATRRMDVRLELLGSAKRMKQRSRVHLHSGTLGKGGTADSLARAKDIRGELLMVWGRQDPHVPLEGRRLIQRTLEEAGVLYSWPEVNAQHALMRDEGHRYDPPLASLVYRLSLDLFARAL